MMNKSFMNGHGFLLSLLDEALLALGLDVVSCDKILEVSSSSEIWYSNLCGAH